MIENAANNQQADEITITKLSTTIQSESSK